MTSRNKKNGSPSSFMLRCRRNRSCDTNQLLAKRLGQITWLFGRGASSIGGPLIHEKQRPGWVRRIWDAPVAGHK